MLITPWLLFAAAASVSGAGHWEASNHKAMWNCHVSSFCRVMFHLTNIPVLTKLTGTIFFFAYKFLGTGHMETHFYDL